MIRGFFLSTGHDGSAEWRDGRVGCTAVLGTQWGDEGKGKIVDCLSKDVDIVARFQGGANAGHTVNVDGRETILHQLPAGILSSGVVCLIGNGVVLDPHEFFNEIEAVEATGLPVVDRLKISPGTHILLPYHKALDRAHEASLGLRKIGTTCRGIGPAYTDKASRKGVRVGDLSDFERFKSIVREEVERKNAEIAALGSNELQDAGKLLEDIGSIRKKLLGMMDDVSLFLYQASVSGKNILLEGAQGTMLDLDHGTYPYVTSSNTTIGAAVIGLGFAPSRIDRVLGVAKAYTTRVGMGPFPTELSGHLGEVMREKGKEYGATTGRPRRCGWFDALVVKYAVRVNGINSIVLTKLDVLDTFEKIKVAVSYRTGDRVVEDLPPEQANLSRATPVYEEYEGWLSDTSSVRNYEDLPVPARTYIERIGALVGCPVRYVSVGPSREALVTITD